MIYKTLSYGKLYIVATPIGNLEDITFRAVRILAKVDLILCEDTRKTKILLDHYKIKTPMISYHQHSRLTRTKYIIDQLKLGKSLALVSDAGTPGISDPGGKLVCEVSKFEKIKIVPIPGPSALTAAASVSGLACDRFVFFGFLPQKKGRQKIFEEIKNEKRTVIFYESPYRLLKTLTNLSEFAADLTERNVIVLRELTKKFEETVRGPIKTVLKEFQKRKIIRGEFVVLIEGRK